MIREILENVPGIFVMFFNEKKAARERFVRGYSLENKLNSTNGSSYFQIQLPYNQFIQRVFAPACLLRKADDIRERLRRRRD